MLGLERKILKSEVNFPLCLAPMVGLSHMSMRLLVRRYLPKDAVSIWPTEMLNSRRIPCEKLGSTYETLRADFEKELVPQILCNEEKDIALSLPKLEQWGAEAIDINMGCPVKKALKHNYGVALMGDIKYAAEVVAMARRHTKLPLSVKLRAGIELDDKFLIDFVQALEGAGANWICLHPRLAEEKRRGKARWHLLPLVRENLKIPVIGNGDVQTADDVIRCLKESNCDMVMVGRALTARPWLMWQVGKRLGFADPEAMQGLKCPESPEEEAKEYGKALDFLLRNLLETHPHDLAIRKFNFYLKNSIGWLDFGNELWAIVNSAKNSEIILPKMQEFFEKDLKLSAKTELRY